MNSFIGNTYEENYGSYSKGHVTVMGAPRITFKNEIFIGNGDYYSEKYDLLASNLINRYYTATLATIINAGSSPTYPTSAFSKSTILI